MFRWVIVRENTEGLYAGVEHMVGDDAAETIRVITRKACERIGRFALGLAAERQKENNPSRLTVVHKANIMKLTDGLFLNTINDTFEKLKPRLNINFAWGFTLDDRIIGLGVAPGANIGDDIAVYEAIHGTAPDIAGQNKANPTSLLLSACMMLKDSWGGELSEYGENIEAAIFKAFKEGNVTGDIIREDGTRGTLGTDEFADAVIANIKVVV
jgi:isocitrate dehydrogenase (NAD+)